MSYVGALHNPKPQNLPFGVTGNPVLAAAVGALITDLLAGPVLGAIPGGHFFELLGIFAFLMLAVGLATAGLQTLFGPFGTLIVIVAFVYFEMNGIGQALLVIAVYFIAGGVVVLGVRRRSRPPVDAATDSESASLAAAVVA